GVLAPAPAGSGRPAPRATSPSSAAPQRPHYEPEGVGEPQGGDTMSPVFSQGALRLPLLKLLEESPRHGYEVIRLLEDRFMGLYAPSPGTIYPRLQRLEAGGLFETRK